MKNIVRKVSERMDNSIFNFIPTARYFVGANFISWTTGEVKIYTDNEKAVNDLIKVINSKRVMYKDKDFYIADVVIKDKKKFKTNIQGIDTKYEYDCLFWGSGIKGDFLLNISNMFVLAAEDASINFERLLRTNFVLKFDYVEESTLDSVVRIGRNIYVTHPWGKSPGSTALDSLDKYDNYLKQLEIYDYTLENLVINDFYDKLINFNNTQEDKNKFSIEELSEVFITTLTTSYCNDKEKTLSELKKYKSIIEDLYGMNLKEIYSNLTDSSQDQDIKELIEKASE